MFSPMSVGAYIYKTIVGPDGEEDEEDGAQREDAGERDSGSDSDGGTSADPPGLRDSLKRAAAAGDTEVWLREFEVTASRTAAGEYTVRKEEFTARLSALRLAEIVGGGEEEEEEEEATIGDVIPDDYSAALEDSEEPVTTSPEYSRIVVNPAAKSTHGTEDGKDRTADCDLSGPDSEHDENAELSNDFGDRILQQDDSGGHVGQDVRQLTQLELDLDTNPDTDSSSATSDETMSTVRENTESCQLESEDQDGFGEGDTGEEYSEDEEHIYIAPDLELPFYKTNVELEQTVNIGELLDNLDKRVVLEPPRPPEERYNPRTISDEELENALKILRRGKPPQKRSWYSLDNVSSSKPNRTFALYYGERRNSAGDDNEPSSPEGNGIVFSLTGISKDKYRSHSAFEHLGEMDNYIPPEGSLEDSVFARPASAPNEVFLEETERDNTPYVMATPHWLPETVADDGPVKPSPVAPLDSKHQYPVTNADPAVSIPEQAPHPYYYDPLEKHPEDVNPYLPDAPGEDATHPGHESRPEEPSYQSGVTYPAYGGTYPPGAPSPEVDASPGPEPPPETFPSVDPALPGPISPPGSNDDAALPDQERSPEPFASAAAPLEPRSEPDTEPIPQPPAELYSGSQSPTELSPRPTPHSRSDVQVEFASECDANPEESTPEATSHQPDITYSPRDSTRSPRAQSPRAVPVGFPSEIDENPDEFPPPPTPPPAYIPNDKLGDLPPPPEDISVPLDQVLDEVNGDILEPENSPMSPEPYISASIKHPRVYYPPSLQTHPQDEQFPRHVTRVHEQHPVFAVKQKQSALSEIENILPVQKSYPPLPPKPNLRKQEAVTEIPISASSVIEEKTPVNFSCLDSNQPAVVIPDESPMSPEPYISASVKLPAVFLLPQFESPISSKAEPLTREGIKEHEQFPVFTNVNRRLAFAELENILPKRKVPPGVAPKPKFKRQQEIVEPDLVSTGVPEVECSVDFSRLDRNVPSNEFPPEPQFVSERPLSERGEEQFGADETTNRDDVATMEARISVFREETEEFYHVPGRPPSVTRAESLQISDAGDLSYIPRDEVTPPEDEVPTQSQDGEVTRSFNGTTPREMVGMTARLSLHRMESGEQFTEAVISIQEQEVREDQQISLSDNEEGVSVFVSATGQDEDEDELLDNERPNDDDTISTEDHSRPFAAFPEDFHSFPGASAATADSNSDHFESPEISSADEFVLEADLAIRKMSAAMNAHRIEETISSSSSSSEDSSASSDSDDSSYESAEEHTYIVTESREGFEEDDCHRYGAVSRPLAQVIEEGEEDEEENYSHDAHDDDDQEKAETVKDEPFEDPEGEEQIEHEDDRVEHMNTKSSDDEVPYKQIVTISLEATRQQPEKLPDSEIPSGTLTETPRYPKYINYDRPMYDNKTAEDGGTVAQIIDLPRRTAKAPPSLRKSPDMLETILADEKDGSASSNESDTTEESSEDSQEEEGEEEEEEEGEENEEDDEEEDEEEKGSDEKEFREQAMDFSSEYSDDPEWLPPPPSTGARVFVLTSNMPYTVMQEARPAQVVIRQSHREDDPQLYEPRYTDMSGTHPEQDADDTEGSSVGDVYKTERGGEDYDKSEEELESDQYFRPIGEFAPTATKAHLEETARPIPQYTTDESWDPPQSSAPEDPGDSCTPGEQKSNAQDVKTLTITYTVIHTKPAQGGGRDADGNTHGTVIPQPDSHQVLKDEDISEDASGRPYQDSRPSKNKSEPSRELSETIQPENAALVKSSPPSGPPEPFTDQPVGNSLPSYGTALDKYESSVRVPEAEGEPETSSGNVPDDSWKHASKSIPVNEVGPFNYNSLDQPGEKRHNIRETTVEQIELRPEVSLFTISPREQSPPHEKPTSPDAPTSPPAGTGPYTFSSWYEEPKDETPAMAIALVKSDIKLPDEYLSERKTAAKPKPSPKSKERPRGQVERLDDGEYTGIRVMWYDEPHEEKLSESDDVIIISSVEPQEESQQKAEAPLSPEVEPGTYKYSAWYEEPSEEPKDETYFVVSRPVATEEQNTDSVKSPASPAKGPGRYKFSAWYDDPPEQPSQEDYFVVSAPSAAKDTSKPASSSTRQREEIFQEGLSRSALYEQYQSPKTAIEDPSATFVISRPYEETGIRPPDEGTRPVKSTADDLYYLREAGTDRNASRSALTVEGNASGASSRNNSYGSSRTSGSLADVSATSGEAMRRTWSDDSDEFRNGKDSSAFEPPVSQGVKKLPPQPKPRKGKPSAPSSSDDEQQQQQLRRPGRSDRHASLPKQDLPENLTPRDEYALASSSWRRIPVEEPHQPRESAIWDSGDDRRGNTRPGDRDVYDNRYSVAEKPRQEIEKMLDSLVDDEDAFDRPQANWREPQLPPQRIDNQPALGRWRNDGTRSMNLLPQTESKRYELVETSFQETRFQSTSESHIAKGQHPDFAQPITVLRPQGNEPSKPPETRPHNKQHPGGPGRQPAPQDDRSDGPPSSRDEYRLAAASWENMSSASNDVPFKRGEMETWDNNPDATAYPAALISKQSHQPERAPGFSEEVHAPPRGPRGKGHGIVITAEVHAPYLPPPVPGDPELAVHMLSVSSSTAELAPPPPTDQGKPRKAHSTVGISQRVPRKPAMEVVMPDAEASVPRRHHRPRGGGLHPPPSGPKSGRPHSPVSVSSYSSTQSLPARILPRLTPDNELEKLKRHLVEIGKRTEIKQAELRKIYTRNPSARHHIPMRGPRGELVSPDGRILSTPEKPNRAELEKYKRFFDKLPEPHFRRLMHEMLEYKHMVKQKEEEIRRLNTQCVGLRRRLARLSQQGK